MSNRRELLRLLGAAPAAVAAVKTELVGMLASPAVAAALTGLRASSTQPQGCAMSPIAKQFSRLLRSHNDDQASRYGTRLKGIDPDLAVFRSMSFVNKARIQRERDVENLSIVQRAQEMIYGE